MNQMFKFYIFISIVFIVACKTNTLLASNDTDIKVADFVKITEKNNEVCSLLDRELNVEFRSGDDSFNVIACDHDGRNPFEKFDVVTGEFRILKEVVLFIKKTEAGYVLDNYAELLLDVNGEKAFCPWGIERFNKYGVSLKSIDFGDSYSVDLSGVNDSLKGFYLESPCFKVDAEKAKRVKGFLVSDFVNYE